MVDFPKGSHAHPLPPDKNCSKIYILYFLLNMNTLAAGSCVPYLCEAREFRVGWNYDQPKCYFSEGKSGLIIKFFDTAISLSSLYKCIYFQWDSIDSLEVIILTSIFNLRWFKNKQVGVSLRAHCISLLT
jgi:hypothetical protein